MALITLVSDMLLGNRLEDCDVVNSPAFVTINHDILLDHLSGWDWESLFCCGFNLISGVGFKV